MSVKVTDSPTSHALQELHDRHQRLYEEPDIDVKIADIIRELGMSAFAVCAVLHRLLQNGVVESVPED